MFSIFGILVLISILIISIPEAQAESFTLVDENSVVTIEVDLQEGVNSWSVDSVNHIFEQWFWIRNGTSGPEVSIDTFTRGTTMTTDGDGDGDIDTLNVKYSDEKCLTVEITWTLKGGPAGSGASTISESIVIESTTPGPICPKDTHFFQYSDFDIAGEFSDDVTSILSSAPGVFDTAKQTNGLALGGATTISETVAFTIPDHHEVDIFPIIKSKLADGGSTTLADSTGPVEGDGSWAFQWDFSLESDPIFTIEICKRIGPIDSGITGNPNCEPIEQSRESGGHEPPTIGKNLAGDQQMVTNGICIDIHCWTVTENFHEDFELVEMLTSPHTISNTIFCANGVDKCNHITLSAEPYGTDINSALWKVSVDKNFQGELTMTVDDPDDYLGVTTCTAKIIEEKYWGTLCIIDFKKPMPGMMLGVQVWDSYKGVRNFYFNDGIEIIDTFGYPSVDTEFESSIDVPRLCLSDNPDKRTSCAFAEKMQLEIERAEKLLT